MKSKCFLKSPTDVGLQKRKITENIKFFVRVAQLIEFFLSLAVATLTPILKKNWKLRLNK